MQENPEPIIPQHQKKSRWTVPYLTTHLTFSSQFDSGNLQSASSNVQLTQITLTAGRDRDTKPSTKTWFHFSIQPQSPLSLPVNLILSKANVLTSLSRGLDLYRPVIRQQGSEWRRLPQPVEFRTVDGDVSMYFKVEVKRRVYVALIFPWSVGENQRYLRELELGCVRRRGCYFNKEVLIYSYEKRPIHLIAISSSQVADNRDEEYIEQLFPERESETHFKTSSKPVILITARVHPGEVGSSHALNGILDFLVSDDELANRMRKQFYFLIVPMLNPDGVQNGNNRMDSLGQNLNRFYHLPDSLRQPSCYSLKLLVQHTRKSLYAFFDLHGHANRKSCFLYGNSIPSLRLQSQSLLFAKLLSLQCPQIDFASCNFSKKQMSSRDRNEEMSKEGCARVVVHRWTNSPFCFTLETGLGRSVWVDDKGVERYGEELYTVGSYRRVGVGMLRVVDLVLKGGKKVEQIRAEMLVVAGRLDKKEAKESKESRQGKEKEPKEPVKKKGMPVTTKEFKFDGTGLTEVVPGKQNNTKPTIHQSISSDKAREIERILHQNKNYLLSMDNQKEDDD